MLRSLPFCTSSSVSIFRAGRWRATSFTASCRRCAGEALALGFCFDLAARFFSSSPRVMMSPLTLAAISSTTLHGRIRRGANRDSADAMSTTNLRNIILILYFTSSACQLRLRRAQLLQLLTQETQNIARGSLPVQR